MLIKHGGQTVRVHSSRIRGAKMSSDAKPSNTRDGEIAPNMEMQAAPSPIPVPHSQDLVKEEPVGDHQGGDATSEGCGPQLIEDVSTDGNHPESFGEEIELKRLKEGERIKFKHPDVSHPVVGTVVGRAGKATGSNRLCYNMKLPDGILVQYGCCHRLPKD